MELLTKLEELVLLTVLRLKEDAYGRTIYEEILKATEKKMSVGNVYFPLERLTQKGYLYAFKGEPTRKRGGMGKRYYRITERGIEILKETFKVNNYMWDNFSILLDSIDRSAR
ncbi:helix-turn-helix transcriptional regulator [candidate division KSB1 bacterium]